MLKLVKDKLVRKKGKRMSGAVQLNILISPELKHKVKLKALRQDRDVSDIVESLLKNWLKLNSIGELK